jgi:hypothetical protein
MGFNLRVGQIGCVFVTQGHRFTENIDTGVVSDESLYYEITWHEQLDYVYGEGLRIRHDKTFPLTDAGLAEAKKTAVDWARQLLQEALDSLPSE